MAYTGLSNFSIFRHCQKKNEEVQLESFLKEFIITFENYEQNISIIFISAFFFIKITEHDLLNISIIHWLTHILNSTVGYLQTKQFLNILLKNYSDGRIEL